MAAHSEKALEMALCAIKSSIGKGEKAILRLTEGTWQHTMMAQGIKAYELAIALIEKDSAIKISSEDANEALRFYKSAIDRVQKVLPKFQVGTAQHTLAVRRISAYTIAMDLIDEAQKEGVL